MLGAARECFAERGYSGAAAEEVVRRAGVTRGAMYHHFGDKLGLFRAVVEEVEREIDGSVQRAVEGAGDEFEKVMAGHHAFLDACLEPEVKRILLLDAPSTLGWEDWHRIEDDHALAQIERGLRSLGGDEAEGRTFRPLAHLVHGALIEAAMFIAAAEDPRRARREVGEGLDLLLRGLAGPSVRGVHEDHERVEGGS